MCNKPICVVSGSAACLLSSWWTSAIFETLFPLAFFEGGSSAAVSCLWGDWTKGFVFFECFGDGGRGGDGSTVLTDWLPSLSELDELSRGSRLRVDRRRAGSGPRGDSCISWDSSREATSGTDADWGCGESAERLAFWGEVRVCVSSVSVLSAGREWGSVGASKQGPSGWGGLAVSASTVFWAACSSSTISSCVFSSDAGGTSIWGETLLCLVLLKY